MVWKALENLIDDIKNGNGIRNITSAPNTQTDSLLYELEALRYLCEKINPLETPDEINGNRQNILNKIDKIESIIRNQ